MIDAIAWLGHASFRIDGSRVVYIDPWKVTDDAPKADLILITHDHYDHCSPDDVARLAKQGTVILAPPAAAAKLAGLTVTRVAPGERHAVGAVTVETLPAYNIGKKFHPRANGNVGYVVTLDGGRLYHAGDTDLIPEMAGIDVDVALLPVGGTYTMTAAEAARAAVTIRPREAAVPIHYGDIVGRAGDGRAFLEAVGGAVPVRLLAPAR
jgi:L-ascorbate metabolism protein UlaG (beta-lactamase superfamily)